MTTIIIGGGVVGLSLAYGLLGQGQDVCVIDGADGDFRASRGNFGLVWVQGKGASFPDYNFFPDGPNGPPGYGPVMRMIFST